MLPTVRLGVLTPSSNTALASAIAAGIPGASAHFSRFKVTEISLQPQAITTFCTNLHAAGLAEAVEAGLGSPLLDTVGAAVGGMLRTAGTDPGAVRGWGQLYGWR